MFTVLRAMHVALTRFDAWLGRIDKYIDKGPGPSSDESLFQKEN